MRNLDKGDKKSLAVAKILLLAIVALGLFILVLKFFNLEKFFLRGPRAVVGLITDSGLKNDNGRVNVLLLGIGGEGHEGPNLTDTIILASVAKKGDDVVLISIPRDLWAPSILAKINAAYAFGQEDRGQGLVLAKKTVSELFEIPIHYAVRVDFGGFVKAVDLIGGLDLDVDNAFVDSKYPVAGHEDDTCGLKIETQKINDIDTQVVIDATGSAIPLAGINEGNDPFTCRYETISFKKGPVHLDGITSLKFVRSRHGTNDEGSDFARSGRQQKVLLAFAQKVLSTETLLNPKKIIDLATTFGTSVDTDISSDEVPLFLKLVQKVDSKSIRRVVLDSGRPESVLDVGDPNLYGGQFVLDPVSNNWHDLAEYVQGEIFKLPEK